jgi:hypothetical protein
MKKPQAIVIGAAAISVAVVIVGVPFLPGRTQPVTREKLVDARRRWEAADILNYNLDFEISGAQTGRYAVEVRDGEATRVTRNGQPATPGDPHYYTIDGLFQTIEREFEVSEQSARGPAVVGAERPTASWVRMRCDDRLGYPVHYVGQIPGRTTSVEIRVHRLEAVADTPRPKSQ